MATRSKRKNKAVVQSVKKSVKDLTDIYQEADLTLANKSFGNLSLESFKPEFSFAEALGFSANRLSAEMNAKLTLLQCIRERLETGDLEPATKKRLANLETSTSKELISLQAKVSAALKAKQKESKKALRFSSNVKSTLAQEEKKLHQEEAKIYSEELKHLLPTNISVERLRKMQPDHMLQAIEYLDRILQRDGQTALELDPHYQALVNGLSADLVNLEQLQQSAQDMKEINSQYHNKNYTEDGNKKDAPSHRKGPKY